MAGGGPIALVHRGVQILDTPACTTLHVPVTNNSAHIYLAQMISMICGFALLLHILMRCFTQFRWWIFREKRDIDSQFIASGKTDTGLVCTHIVSISTWTAVIMQSSSVGATYGLSGPLWYASGAAIQVLLFAIVSIQLKIRAPGARTFLQSVRARFGTLTHLTLCFFFLTTNLAVIALMILGACPVLTRITSGLSWEMCTGLCVLVIAAITTGGGLGGAYYVFYLSSSTLLVLAVVFCLAIFNSYPTEPGKLGSLRYLYNLLHCRIRPDNNFEGSYLTILSKDGLMFGIINVIGSIATVFPDQSYWQASTAAKPLEGVFGILAGAMIWFIIPYAFGTICGLGYLGLGVLNGTDLLTSNDVNDGLVPQVIAGHVFGWSGEFAIIIAVLISVASTGYAEVNAITSILIYDLYATYFRPFRRNIHPKECILCGRRRGNQVPIRQRCDCQSMSGCKDCEHDEKIRGQQKHWALKPPYTCAMHGLYRYYIELLDGKMRWCMLFTLIGIIPLSLFVNFAKINQSWWYNFMGILVGSAVGPICYTAAWGRLTAWAVILGCWFGAILGIVIWLVYAGILAYSGVDLFINCTGLIEVMLVGNCISISSGFIIPVLVTLMQTRNYSTVMRQPEAAWDGTREVENPLHPWPELFVKELRIVNPERLDDGRPNLFDVQRTFRFPIKVATVGSISLSVVLVIVWPALASTTPNFSYESFAAWIYTMEIWLFVVTAIAIFWPLINELSNWKTAYAEKRILNLIREEEDNSEAVDDT